MKDAKKKTFDMVYIALFAVVMAVCAWIVIPMAVPFTLQTFGVFLAVGVLGGRKGTIAVFLYLLLGLVGKPRNIEYLLCKYSIPPLSCWRMTAPPKGEPG